MQPDMIDPIPTPPQVDLRALLMRAFAWTSIAAMLTTIVAGVIGRLPGYREFFGSPFLVIIAVALWVGVTVVLLRAFNRLQSIVPVILFFAYPILTGLCLPALFVASPTSIVGEAFLCVTLLFAIMTHIAVVSSVKLTEFRFYLYSGALAALVSILVNLVLEGGWLNVVINLVLVVGYTLCVFALTDDMERMARAELDRIEDDEVTLIRLPFRASMRMFLSMIALGGRAGTQAYARMQTRRTPPPSA